MSLRDVVRAMIIFEWFLIKLTLDEFKILLRKKAEVEENKRYMSDSELKKTKKENLTGIQRLSISVQVGFFVHCTMLLTHTERVYCVLCPDRLFMST